jgi:hypothetical protein
MRAKVGLGTGFGYGPKIGIEYRYKQSLTCVGLTGFEPATT